MECTLAFFNRDQESLAQYIDVGVVWEFYIVCTCHHRDKKIIRSVGGFARFANHGEHWSQALETYNHLISKVREDLNIALLKDLPPIGSFGLPVTN